MAQGVPEKFWGNVPELADKQRTAFKRSAKTPGELREFPSEKRAAYFDERTIEISE